MNSVNRKPIIFTDLDGTLLDQRDYSFSAALSALKKIEEMKIPLIINSSKTCAEIIDLQSRMSIYQPFISENGAAIYLPVAMKAANETLQTDDFRSHAFARSHVEVLGILHALRKENQYQFAGFSDWGVQAIKTATGLTLAQSTLASLRDYTEPLIWQDSQERLNIFTDQLKEHGLITQQGGRFLSVTDKVDKAQAMQWLCEQLGGEHCVIALGDSHNDEAMLNVADIAVVIKSKHSEKLTITKPKEVIRTNLPGPAGWQVGIEEALALIK